MYAVARLLLILACGMWSEPGCDGASANVLHSRCVVVSAVWWLTVTLSKNCYLLVSRCGVMIGASVTLQCHDWRCS